jgi:hypothetical protein
VHFHVIPIFRHDLHCAVLSWTNRQQIACGDPLHANIARSWPAIPTLRLTILQPLFIRFLSKRGRSDSGEANED